jgi:hypothetical protein
VTAPDRHHPKQRGGVPGGRECRLRRNCDTDPTGLVSLDYWMTLPLLLVIATMLVVRIKKYLSERQEAEEESLIMGRAGGVELPAAGGGPGLLSYIVSQEQSTGERRSGQATPTVQLRSKEVCRGCCF